MALNLNAVINLALGAITRGRDAEREIAKITGDAAAEGISAGMVRGTAQAKAQVGKTLNDLMKVGMGKAAHVLRDQIEQSSRQQIVTANKIARIEQGINRAADDAQKRRLLEQKKELQDQLKKQEKAQAAMLDKAEKAAEGRIETMRRARERMDRTSQQKAEAAADSFKSMVEGGLSLDEVDPSNLTESIMKGLSGGAEALSARIMAGGAGATAGGAKAIAALGATAGALAAATAGVVAVVALFSAAYGQAKDMNKSIMEGVSAFDMQRHSVGELGTSLRDLRKVSINLAYDFRMSKEETLGAIKAFNEAGLTLNEFRRFARDTVSDTEAYTQVARMAIIATQSLNLSFDEVASFANTLSRDLGEGLLGVQGAFGMISSEAVEAGMNTKDFFSAINAATSGMALYNFRVGDTVALFTDLVDILGEDLAQEKIGLEKTFRNMGGQERYKSRILMGGGRSDRIMQADADRQAKDFARRFAPELKKVGLLAETGGGVGVDMDSLMNMSPREFRDMMSQLSPEAARQIQDLQNLGRGGITGMGSVSKTGELAMQLAQGATMRTDAQGNVRALRDLRGMERVMMEEVTGLTGDAYDQMAALETGLLAKYEEAGGADAFDGADFFEALASGKLVGNEELESMSDEHFMTMEQAARETLKETRGFSQTLSNVIGRFLEKIYNILEWMMDKFAKGNARKASLQAIRESQGVEETVRAELGAGSSNISDLKKALETTQDPGEKERLQKTLLAAEARQHGLREQVGREAEFQRELSRGKGVGEAFETILSPEQEKMLLGKARELGAVTQKGKEFTNIYGNRVETWATEDAIDFENMTPEQKALLEEELRVLEETKQADFLRNKNLKKMEELEGDQIDLFEDLIDEVGDLSKKEALSQLVGKTSARVVNRAILNQDFSGILSQLRSDEDGLTEEEKAILYTIDPKILEGVKDFIYRGDGVSGTITPIDKMDQFFGARPDGPIHQGVKGAGAKNVSIYINGGDTDKIRSVVTKVLRDTGYGDMKSYG